MDDLQMIKRCAEKMEYLEVLNYTNTIYVRDKDGVRRFDPINDDAQAMALVKKFELDLEFGTLNDEWSAISWDSDSGRTKSTSNKDLNRAIVECVSKLV